MLKVARKLCRHLHCHLFHQNPHQPPPTPHPAFFLFIDLHVENRDLLQLYPHLLPLYVQIYNQRISNGIVCDICSTFAREGMNRTVNLDKSLFEWKRCIGNLPSHKHYSLNKLEGINDMR